MKSSYLNLKTVVLFFMLIIALQSCDKTDDCTRIDKIGGGLLPEQDIEVPCDFPEAPPLVGLDRLKF